MCIFLLRLYRLLQEVYLRTSKCQVRNTHLIATPKATVQYDMAFVRSTQQVPLRAKWRASSRKRERGEPPSVHTLHAPDQNSTIGTEREVFFSLGTYVEGISAGKQSPPSSSLSFAKINFCGPLCRAFRFTHMHFSREGRGHENSCHHINALTGRRLRSVAYPETCRLARCDVP